MYKKCKKIVASMIVFIMMIANLSTVGINIGEVIAISSDLNNQNSKTNNSNIEFDAYFENSVEKYNKTLNVDEENKIIAKITVKNSGYLKDAMIKFDDANFKIMDITNSDKVLKVEDNIITLKQINSVSEEELEIPIMLENNNNINVAELSKVNTIKFTGIYIDGDGKTNNIEKEISLNLTWTEATVVTIAEGEVINFVPYDTGLKLQLNVRTYLRDNILPMKTIDTTVKLPQIAGFYPTAVTVNSITDYTNIGEDKYTYDNDGILKIAIQNSQNENGEIAKDNTLGNYIISCTYLSEAYNNAIAAEKINVSANVSTNITLYNNDSEFSQSIKIEKQFASNYKDSAINYSMSATDQISKGYMYANEIAEEKIETVYEQKISAIVIEPEALESINVNSLSDKLNTDKADIVPYECDTYYKNVKIDKNLFNTILGEDGYIKITSDKGIVTEINKTTLTDEQTVIELNAKQITITTNKPVAEGKLTLEFEKAISKDFENSYIHYSTRLISRVNVETLETSSGATSNVIMANTNLVEPETSVMLKMDNANLSTITKNENVEIRAILKTDSEYNRLFTNPIITITLPSYIENIEIKDVKLFNEEELTRGTERVIQNPDGTKQLEIVLGGRQTKYDINSIYGGANVIITADIEVNKLTPNRQETITMTCVNEKETATATLDVNFIAPVGVVATNKVSNYAEGKEVLAIASNETATLEVTTSAKTATVEMQVINNYNNKLDNIKILGRTLMSGTTNIDTEESLNNTFDAPMLGAINTNGITNAVIYYSENGAATADLENNENGWTTTVTDFSKIKTYLIVLTDYELEAGNTIKFSYNVGIPANLEYMQNISTLYTVYFNNIQEEQTIQDKVKSPLITLTTGVAPTLEVNLQSNSAENSAVREGQYVRFVATVRNVGIVDAENAVLKIKAPNGNIYTYIDSEGNVKFTEDVSIIENPEKQLAATYSTKHTSYIEENFSSGYEDTDEIEKVISIGSIKAGETVRVEYELKIESVEVFKNNLYMVGEEGKETLVEPEVMLNNIARVMADDMQKEVSSNTYKLKIDEGYMQILMQADKSSDYTLIKGTELNYSATVKSLYSQGALKNVVVKMQLSKGVTTKNAEIENLVITDQELKYTTQIDNENNIVTFTIEELPVGAEIVCKAQTEIGDIEGTIEATASVVADGIGIHYSNVKTNKVDKLRFTIKQQTLESQYVKEQEEITYIYEIENMSDVYTNSFKFENPIPDGMKFVSAKIIRGETEQEIINEIKDGKFVIDLNSFKGGAKIKIQVTMIAELLPSGVTEKEFINYATISGNDFETMNSNEVKTVIEYNEEAHKKPQDTDDVDDPNYNPDNGDGDDDNGENGGNKNGRYIISGIAWVDKNENGTRDDGEELLTGVEVRLLNKATNEVVKDVDSGTDKVTQTSSTGEYRFTNLEKGEYLVVFLYNTYKYELTQYKKENVNASVNSDVINLNMDIDGKEQKVAVSDTLRITNSNIRNIDIGLCETHKSSMNLDKYISTVTVTYGNTVKTYDYENSNLVKVEIPAKELANATVIVEYKIVVTNTGSVANYVKKIVDYIPDGMKFNSELNRDWYQSSNGDLYNSSLANTKLESGESAEVTLTLTKKMTDSNTGIVNNNAEIYEVYNEEGILDTDSTSGNKVNGENDMSSADLVISVKTGDAIMYTVLIATIISISIGVSAYYIRKKVLRKM